MTNAKAFGLVGQRIKLRSGIYFDLGDPRPEQIDLGDITRALSKICRFGGHGRYYYSVAEHLVLCKLQAERDELPPAAVKAVFLHDATEAYIGDMVKPLKMMLSEYQRIEERIEAAIGVRFGIDFDEHAAAVSKIDCEMLIAERGVLFDNDDVTWYGQESVRRLLQVPFAFCQPHEAELIFRQHCTMLGLT